MDILILAGGLNWVMGFEPGEAQLKISGMTEAFRAAPARVGEHLHGRCPRAVISTSPGRRSARSTCLRS